MSDFDDSRLDDPACLERADGLLRPLALAGARVRQAADGAVRGREELRELPVPRAVIAAGAEARLIRALVEPTCPVPFMAWPQPGLPGWVGPLDLVVVSAADGGSPGLVATAREAVRRGAALLIACPVPSLISEFATGRASIVLPAATSDPLAAAVVALAGLHDAGLAPATSPELIADALDQAATDCSPRASIAANPAKDIALGLADAQPLIWGGSVLAARASRRIAEAIRAATGRPALAGEAEDLLPLLEAAGRRDPFADPFTDLTPSDRRPVLVMLDDGSPEESLVVDRRRLTDCAEFHEIRICPISCHHGSDLERYVSILQVGLYAATYLAIGLDRLAR
ncbi:SIS domain-containing protein [Naumannella halotolerans]|uniref:SIS domain-containing protein n=1 Tax=Naumannella halotolerans TaxID=993414 RepID=UPI00370DC85B